MLKLLAKVAEKYARNTNVACCTYWLLHQPKRLILINNIIYYSKQS